MFAPAVSLAVVGIDYPNKRGPARRFELALLRPGDPVQLVPEPKNPMDPRAVMVVSERDVCIGYVTAERCGMIGKMIAEGREPRAIFQRMLEKWAVIRVAFDGETPTLPAEPAPKRARDDVIDPDPGFYPDELPPDW